MHPKHLSILDFTYSLPDERIAGFPLPERDASRLLVYRSGQITEDRYKNIVTHLPAKSLLIFNDTKVIPARILFQKPSGGMIEIFCLEPYETVNDYNTILQTKGSVQWKCMIGGASKWKQGLLEKKCIVGNTEFILQASLVEKLPDAYVVQLSWQPEHLTFSEIIDMAGDTPLPPYIKRKAEESDKKRYQTIYARHDGSVAAPTAGLHFTPDIFSSLELKEIRTGYVTLHVGAGTFKPVKAAYMQEHEMHAEWIDVTIERIAELIAHLPSGIVAVGTTSVRSLESLYWMGVKTILSPDILPAQLTIQQWEVYESPLSDTRIPAVTALESLLKWMQRHHYTRLFTPTRILIAPGYHFNIPVAIITNFHQPQSTLLLLVAAAIGDHWNNVYDYALKNDFRFLSYGDGCLLFLPEKQMN